MERKPSRWASPHEWGVNPCRMWKGTAMRLLGTAREWLNDLQRSWHHPRPSPQSVSGAAIASHQLWPLERVLLTDGVGRTLFEEFSLHRSEAHGEEETGWLLLGIREAKRSGRFGHTTGRHSARCECRARPVQQQCPGVGQPHRARQTDRRLTTLAWCIPTRVRSAIPATAICAAMGNG